MQVGFVCCDGTKRPYAECIQHAGEHQCQWTAALLTAMAGNVREQKEHLTITELSGLSQGHGVEEDAGLLRVP